MEHKIPPVEYLVALRSHTPQDGLQNPTIAIVLQLDRCIDPACCLKAFLTVTRCHDLNLLSRLQIDFLA
jgi:hypothetical protein